LTIFLSFWAMGLEEMPGSAGAPGWGRLQRGFLFPPEPGSFNIPEKPYQKTVKFNGD
jgi:hypothetical protein